MKLTQPVPFFAGLLVGVVLACGDGSRVATNVSATPVPSASAVTVAAAPAPERKEKPRPTASATMPTPEAMIDEERRKVFEGLAEKTARDERMKELEKLAEPDAEAAPAPARRARRTGGLQTRIVGGDGYLMGYDVVVNGDIICSDPFVWTGTREIECD